jgi:hypothetical protein
MQHTLPAPSCFRLEGTREAAHVVLERTFVPQELHVGTIHPYATLLALGDVLVASQRCEAPVFADDNLLTAGELVLSAAESFDGGSTVGITSADREDDLADVDTGDGAVGLAEGATHASLQSIGTSARQHLVDADNVVRVSAHTHVETFLAGNLDEILVGADARSLEGFGAQLLILVGHQVDAGREFIDIRTFTAQIEDADLGVWHTTVEAGFRVWLVLAVAVAPRWTTSHGDSYELVGVAWI